MEITVKSKYLKVSPRKMRPVLFSVRGQKVEKLLEVLPFVRKEAARLIYDIVKSGSAAARENDIGAGELYVKSITCNEGPKLRRRRFQSRGRVSRITKRMSHLVLTVTNDLQAEAGKKEIKNQVVKEKFEARNPKSETGNK